MLQFAAVNCILCLHTQQNYHSLHIHKTSCRRRVPLSQQGVMNSDHLNDVAHCSDLLNLRSVLSCLPLDHQS
jgi:hypothetical protein